MNTLAPVHKTIRNPQEISDFKAELSHNLLNLQKYARSFCSDSAHADDLVQDTLIRAMEKCHLYQDGTNLKAWLYRMMHNIFCNKFKRAKRYQEVDAEKVLPTIADQGNQEDRIRLMKTQVAFNMLDPVFREALYLVAVEGMSYQEAAEVMDVKVGTVKSRVSRARSEILQKMKTIRLQSNDNRKVEKRTYASHRYVDLMPYTSVNA